MTIIGIDPGKTGALSLLVDGEIKAVEDMPIDTILTGKKRLVIDADNNPTKEALTRTVIPAQGVFDIICRLCSIGDWKNVHVFLERVHEMPGQSGMFNFGRSYGLVEMAVTALALPLNLVEPTRWKPAMGCTADKTKSREKAKLLFPSVAEKFKRVKDDGRAESALIAMWGHRSMNRISA